MTSYLIFLCFLLLIIFFFILPHYTPNGLCEQLRLRNNRAVDQKQHSEVDTTLFEYGTVKVQKKFKLLRDGYGHGNEPQNSRSSGKDHEKKEKKFAPATKTKRNLIQENLAQVDYEDGNPLKPMVHIADSVLEELFAPWQDALVIKLLDKSIDFNTMKECLGRIWKLSAGFELMDIGHGFLMVKFDVAADRTMVMEKGPWYIFNHHLTVRPWSPDFLSPVPQIDKTLVWIRFPSLNFIYYDESILLVLATAVGSPVMVDANSLDVHRGRFARVCVEVDLTKPLVRTVWLHGHWYNVEYEGLDRLCSTREDCGVKRAPPPLSGTTAHKDDQPVHGAVTVTDNNNNRDMIAPSKATVAKTAEDIRSDFKRKEKPNPNVNSGKEGSYKTGKASNVNNSKKRPSHANVHVNHAKSKSSSGGGSVYAQLEKKRQIIRRNHEIPTWKPATGPGKQVGPYPTKTILLPHEKASSSGATIPNPSSLHVCFNMDGLNVSDDHFNVQRQSQVYRCQLH